MSLPTTKAALEALLRERRLQAEAPPLRGEIRIAPLPTGIGPLDGLLGGGLPKGRLSEVHGPASSGRTAVALAAVARTTAEGALAAWVDPADRLDPASAAAAGADLARLLWLRGRSHAEAVAAAATLLGAGLFSLVVLDLAACSARELGRLPGSTWHRLERAVADTPAALLLLAAQHVACGPGGAAVALGTPRTRFSGAPGPGRLLRGLDASASAGRHDLRSASFQLGAL
ncbi:MAG: hypothetical protein AB7O37_04290 [Vicinamibacteria bacterium]